MEARSDTLDRTARLLLAAVAVGFTVAFVVIVVPALVDDGWDVWGGALDGFVNPYASGYSTDVLFTYAALAIWVVRDAVVLKVRRGWIALLLGVVPGVAVGLAVYLILRQGQVRETSVG
ncbi:hypothetical protein HMPREF0063_11559 [Aeromicrobium marinum DSM 15272]|uniref:DUF2834 domain-containing protein n=1 Tax=Aeromicrobium marinum DSM 15272 TaxID=585531 RepID=E2SC00_9ACTN|nr:DUF2834 domain-containing protein [Aeromicrobium marinum]EFQ83286.1 hypothetical protein HMPREF0063_11559 [Aeromicrobium marinum DSM 15272]